MLQVIVSAMQHELAKMEDEAQRSEDEAQRILLLPVEVHHARGEGNMK